MPEYSDNLIQQYIDDSMQSILIQGIEDDHIIDPVYEFRFEMLIQLRHDPFFYFSEIPHYLWFVLVYSDVIEIESDVCYLFREFLASDI